jgi:phytoene synthase
VRRSACDIQPEPRLAQAFDVVREITRREAGNFYHGLKLTPEPKRSALYSIYAWMREADDIVDAEGPIEPKRAELDAFTARTQRVFAGNDASDGALGESASMWLAFAETVERFGLELSEFRDLISGMREDLELDALERTPSAGAPQIRYATREDLSRYCYHVASTVGIVCMRVWGTREGVSWERARELAILRGRAFQLTNILRDFAGDFEEGRVYLAREDFQRFGLTPESLLAWSDDARCTAMVRSIATWARDCYDRSAGLDERIATDCAPAMWAMTRIYSGLLHTIERQPALSVGETRAHLPTYRKVAIGVRALVRSVKA